MLREDLSKHPLTKTIEAIKAGDQETAIRCAQEIWDEGRPLHDLYGDMAGLLVTYIADKLGEQAVDDAWRYVGEQIWKPIVMQFKEQGTDALVQAYAAFNRAHGHGFYAEEDEEKTVFVMDYCASGGRLMKEGKHDNCSRHPINIGTTKNAYSWGFNQKGISYYCIHTPLWMDILPREWGWDVFESTFGRQFDENGNMVNEPCKTIIYKKPRS